ncbi:MAG: DUF2726 domain-containing protein [Eubacteriales bacterium]|nr:DUF2726 domain-containing protein [Eubacteriales bacterium]
MKWIYYALIILILAIALSYKCLDKKKPVVTIDYKKAYQAKYLLTKNEYHEYIKLKEIASNKDLLIFPKVRVLDIIEPIHGQKQYKTLLNKVQSKHVDFLMCDKKLSIKCIIEIDDKSHERTDRKERDEFLNEIFESVGYKVIHTNGITEETLLNV